MKTDEIMSVDDHQKFADLDEIIKAGAKTFLEVGHALVKVHEGKLYKAHHYKTFEEYARARGISRPQAYKLMSAVQLTMELENVSHARHDDNAANIEALKKSSEKAVGALGSVPKSARLKVLQHASEKTGGKLTARAIRESAAQVRHISKPQPTQKIGEKFRNSIEIPDSLIPPQTAKELTPERFKTVLDELEKMIPAECDHKKFGVIANAFATRQMNFSKTKDVNFYG